MKIKTKKFIFGILLVVLFIYPLFYIGASIKGYNSEKFAGDNELQISTYYNTAIIINDLPGSLTNWSWAKDQGYCTGSGTSGSPYVIKNHIFNTSLAAGSPLQIQNSLQHFVIEDCLFFAGTNYGGIYMVNVSNGIIRENSMVATTGTLIYMRNSSYNVISNNNASNGAYCGILLQGSIGPTRYNTISNNLVSNNNNWGILLRDGSEYNTIYGNVITNTTGFGIELEAVTANNKIYLNCFNNSINAMDYSTNNTWDNGVKGNYWDDYPGVDANGNGIGDTPYNIPGTVGNQDNYPLMECPKGGSSGGIPGYDIGILVSSLIILILGTAYLTLKRKRISHIL